MLHVVFMGYMYVLLYAMQWFIQIYHWNENRYFHCSVFRDYFLLYLMFNSL